MDFKSITNIAYLGPSASFSEMAYDAFCEKYDFQVPPVLLKTVPEIIDYVNTNPDCLGILPIENSIDGTLRLSLDSLISEKNTNIKILSELILPIEYCLLSKTTEFYSITGIIGTPNLFAKCNEFIKNEMPYNINIIEQASMNEAAKELSNHNLTYSSIGNKKIAEVYHLNILKENINDDKTNQTRYVLIGNFDTEITGDDKTTLVFATKHTPGALLEILKIFLENDINLTYIASRPAKHDLDEYIFIVNFDGHVLEPRILDVLNQIKPKTMYLRCLGSYKKNYN